MRKLISKRARWARRAVGCAAAGLVAAALLIHSTTVASAKSGKNSSNPPLGINLAPWVYWSSDFAFIDYTKGAAPWGSKKAYEPWIVYGTLDTDQYGEIQSLDDDQWATRLLLRAVDGHFPAGRYVCLYDGEGEIHLRFSGLQILEREPGRILVDITAPANSGVEMQLRQTNPSNPVRNVRFIHESDLEAYESGEVFHQAFQDSWAPFGVVRFMDWQYTNGSELMYWEDRSTPRHVCQTFDDKGVALEHMIDLCNQLKVEPWFCMPHTADDNFVREFATMVRDQLHPKLNVYVEYSNELWNWGFPQTVWAQEQGRLHELGTQEEIDSNSGVLRLRWTAHRTIEILRIWREVFGSKSDRVLGVISSQTVSTWTSEQLLTWENAAEHVHALAIAPYFDLTVSEDTALEMTNEELFESLETAAIPLSIERTRRQREVADRFGVKLLAYEAGQHLVSRRYPELNDRFQAMNRDTRMGELYQQYITGMRGHLDLMMLYHSCARYDRFGAWGLKEYGDQAISETPKYRAVIDLIYSKPAPGLGRR